MKISEAWLWGTQARATRLTCPSAMESRSAASSARRRFAMSSGACTRPGMCSGAVDRCVQCNAPAAGHSAGRAAPFRARCRGGGSGGGARAPRRCTRGRASAVAAARRYDLVETWVTQANAMVATGTRKIARRHDRHLRANRSSVLGMRGAPSALPAPPTTPRWWPSTTRSSPPASHRHRWRTRPQPRRRGLEDTRGS